MYIVQIKREVPQRDLTTRGLPNAFMLSKVRMPTDLKITERKIKQTYLKCLNNSQSYPLVIPCPYFINPLPHMPILDSSNSTAKTDMMSKIWKNGDIVENIVGKEEIARYEQFLLFPRCFQKLSVFSCIKNEYLWCKGYCI